MSNQANITQVPRSPQLPARIAQAVEAGKLAAQRQGNPSQPLIPGAKQATASGNAEPQTFELVDTRVELHFDRASGLVVGRVFDRRTNEEIRQIPAEAMVRLAASLKKELAPLVNIKA